MNKILFLSLALFVAETVSAEEGLQPYLFFGNSGQTLEDTNESISTAAQDTRDMFQQYRVELVVVEDEVEQYSGQ